MIVVAVVIVSSVLVAIVSDSPYGWLVTFLIALAWFGLLAFGVWLLGSLAILIHARSPRRAAGDGASRA